MYHLISSCSSYQDLRNNGQQTSSIKNITCSKIPSTLINKTRKEKKNHLLKATDGCLTNLWLVSVCAHSRAKSMNEITVTLSFSNTHTLYKKRSKFWKTLKKIKISKISTNFKISNFQESYAIKQLLDLNFASFNIVVLCSIKPHIDLVSLRSILLYSTL